MGYEYDIFLSYPRKGQVCPWVYNHFCRCSETAWTVIWNKSRASLSIVRSRLVFDGRTISKMPYCIAGCWLQFGLTIFSFTMVPRGVEQHVTT